MTIGTQRPAFGHLHLPEVGRPSRVAFQKALLACGAASAVLWVGMDVVASLALEGYSYADQTISELSAIGTKTRPYWIGFGAVYSLLQIAFGVGVWRAAGPSRALRVAALLLVVPPIIGLTVGPFSSMHQREVLAADGGTFSDTLHLVVTGTGVFFFLFTIGFAARALGKWFRVYSVVTVIAMLVFGAATSLYAPEVQDNEPTPSLGIYERINAYGYMLWLVAFSAVLLWTEGTRARAQGSESGLPGEAGAL